MKSFFSYLRNHYSMLTKITLFILSVIILVLIFPKEGRFKYEFTKGKPWMHEDLIAPFDFAILKSQEELEAEEKEVISRLKPYFRIDDSITSGKRDELIVDFNTKWKQKYPKTGRQEERKQINLNLCLSIYDSIMNTGILEPGPDIEKPDEAEDIYVIHKNQLLTRKAGDLFTLQKADQLILGMLKGNRVIDENLVIAILENVLMPNVVYDEKTYENEKQTLLDKISETRGMVQDDEMIIGRGELVSADQYQVLESLRLDYESKLGSDFKYAGILAGQIILMAVTMVSLFLFLYFFRKEVFDETKQIVLLLLLILFMVFVTSLVVIYSPEYVYLVPVCMIPIVIGVFMDSRLALFVHLITIIITGFLVPNSYDYFFLQLFAGIFTILSTVRLERRAQFFFASLMIFLIYSVTYTGMTLIKEGSLQDINYTYYALFGGSAVLTLFSQPFIYIF